MHSPLFEIAKSHRLSGSSAAFVFAYISLGRARSISLGGGGAGGKGGKKGRGNCRRRYSSGRPARASRTAPSAFGKWKLNEVCWKISARWYATPLPTDALQSDTCHATSSPSPVYPPRPPLEHSFPSSPRSLGGRRTALDIGYISMVPARTPFSPSTTNRRAFSIPRLRSRATPEGHLWYQSTEAFPRNWFLRNVKQPESCCAAPDFVYLFSVEVNSRYLAAGGRIKASGSAELIKQTILLRNFLAFFERPRTPTSAYALVSAIEREIDPIALATTSFTCARMGLEIVWGCIEEMRPCIFLPLLFVRRYNRPLDFTTK